MAHLRVTSLSCFFHFSFFLFSLFLFFTKMVPLFLFLFQKSFIAGMGIRV